MAQKSQQRQIMEADPPKAEPPEDRTKDMSFLDHLEELRWHIIKGLIGIGVGVAIAYFFSDYIVNVALLGPTKADFGLYKWLGIEAIDLRLQSRKLPGQFFAYWGAVIVTGVIIGTPILIYQLWKFIEPAMELTEKRKTTLTTLFITSFFLMGIAFGYFILTPYALQFFSQFQISDVIHNDFDINQYFSSVTMWVLSCGILFQLPVVSYYLTKFGILTPEFMKQYRRHSIVVCFLLSAFLTPPDPVSQVMIAVPLILLYQFGIWLSKLAVKRRKKELAKFGM